MTTLTIEDKKLKFEKTNFSDIKELQLYLFTHFWSYKNIDKSKQITENGFTQEFEDNLLKEEKDPNNTSYWPFYTIEEFLTHLNSNNDN